jgi:hypothetical protein
VGGISTKNSIIISPDEQNHEMYDGLYQAEFNSNSSTKNRHHVLCQIGLNGTMGDYIICNSNQTDLPCLPHYHECVNRDDPANPCNMSCWDDLQKYERERERMYKECPIVDDETKETIKQIKFWVDGVSKVLIIIVVHVTRIHIKDLNISLYSCKILL